MTTARWLANESNIAFHDSAAGTESNLSGNVTITGNSLTTALYPRGRHPQLLGDGQFAQHLEQHHHQQYVGRDVVGLWHPSDVARIGGHGVARARTRISRTTRSRTSRRPAGSSCRRQWEQRRRAGDHDGHGGRRSLRDREHHRQPDQRRERGEPYGDERHSGRGEWRRPGELQHLQQRDGRGARSSTSAATSSRTRRWGSPT